MYFDVMELELHRKALLELIRVLEADGWRCIDLANRRPDGIAIKDGRIIALQATGVKSRVEKKRKGKGRSRGWKPWGGTYTQKRQRYDMFDDVKFAAFNPKTGEIRYK